MGAKRSKRTERRERGSGGKLPFRTTLTFPSFFCRTQIRPPPPPPPPPLSHSPLTKGGGKDRVDKKGKEGGGATFFTYLGNGEMEKLKRRKKEGRRGEDLQSITSREKKRRDLGLVYSTTPEEKER